MKLISITSAFCLLMVSSLALAAKTPTEATKLEKKSLINSIPSRGFFQAPANTWVATPYFEQSTQVGKIRGGYGEIKEYGTYQTISLERGWTKNFASELVLQNYDLTMKAPGMEVDKKGLGDLRLTLKGQNSLANDSSAHYGAHIKVSPGNKENTIQFVSFTAPYVNQTKTSAQTGSRSITPYFGYQTKVAGHYAGVRATQTIWGSKRKIENKGSAVNFLPLPKEERGGGLSEIRAYYEYQISDKFMLGTLANYKWTSKIQQTTGSGYQTVTSPRQILSIGAYPTYAIDKNLVLLGSASYQTLMTKDIIQNNAPLEDGNIVDLSLGGRFTF